MVLADENIGGRTIGMKSALTFMAKKLRQLFRHKKTQKNNPNPKSYSDFLDYIPKNYIDFLEYESIFVSLQHKTIILWL